MKNFIALILFLLSINGQTQSNLSKYTLENNPINSYSDKHFESATKEGATDQRSVIQLYDSIYNWHWDAGTGWIRNGKCIDMVYDENHNITSQLTKYWIEGEWVNSWLESFTYHDNNKINYLNQIWTGSNWLYNKQQSFTYDLNHNKISETFQSFNGIEWRNLDSNIFSYDTNNNLINEVCLNYYSNSWHNGWQYIYLYDDSMVLTQQLEKDWSGGEWVDYQRTTFTYDSYLNVINELEQKWDGNFWINSYQNLYTYDAYNNRITEKTQEWINGNWVNQNQFLNTYDENHNLMTITGEGWVNFSWKTYTRLRNSYDADNFKLSQVYKVCQNGDNVVTGGDSTLYYFKTVVGTYDLSVPPENFSVYPNPAFNTIIIELPDFRYTSKTTLFIYNVNSQPVITRRITDPLTVIDIHTLPGGVYFTRITNDRTVVVGKFVKQ